MLGRFGRKDGYIGIRVVRLCGSLESLSTSSSSVHVASNDMRLEGAMPVLHWGIDLLDRGVLDFLLRGWS